MSSQIIEIKGRKKSVFLDKVEELLPEGGNLHLCLTCGACSSGCPATGLENLDPRKFLRMAALGMDEEITSTPWVWMCTMCQRCLYVGGNCLHHCRNDCGRQYFFQSHFRTWRLCNRWSRHDPCWSHGL